MLEELLVDRGVDALVPEAEIFQAIGIIQVGYMINVHEAVNRAQFDQPLLAYHLDLYAGR